MNAILLLVAAAASSAVFPEMVGLAFSNMQDRQVTQCGFTRSMQDGDLSTIERFDPSQGSWELREIDGRAPNAKELEKFSDDQGKRANRTLPTVLEFDDLAVPGSYKLLDDSNLEAVYEFAPVPEAGDDKKVTDVLVGKLVVDKDLQSVAYFEVSNTKPFSPAFGVKVRTLYQKIEYQWLAEQEVFVIGEVTVKMSGRAFGMKKVSQDMTVTFGEFDCSRS
jgi:hypothetical protein